MTSDTFTVLTGGDKFTVLRQQQIFYLTTSARQAVAASRSRGPVEKRMRAALGVLAKVYASRGVAMDMTADGAIG
jgi:hypothetical protein